MYQEKRDVTNILYFRNDISPFLVHLTRNTSSPAQKNLESILASKSLHYGAEPISDAKYRYDIHQLDRQKELDYFSAVSFTETPLNEIHNLLDITRRQIDLQPYGLVFQKEKLKRKGVSPVIYINNINGQKDKTVEALCNLIDTHPGEAAEILPYIAIFGNYLTPLGGTRSRTIGEVDFMWEREWRHANRTHEFKFEESDVFIGLCPHDEISHFERMFSWLHFIDPRRNMKWYADRLVEARQRLDLKYSVV